MKKKQYRYLQVKKELFDYIQGLPDQTRIPPRTELVERFHVTRTTVDRAISELIGKGYLTSKIGSGTYVVKGKTSPLEPNQSIDNWGLILPNIAKDSYPELVRAVEDVCCASMINLIICNTDNDSQKEYRYMQKLMNSNVSGIIIVPTVNNVLLDGYRELKDHGIKYVFCNRRVEGLNAPKVVGNDFYGSNLVTKYLLSKGWKKPAYISVPYYSTSEQRYIGYQSALCENNIPLREEYVIFSETAGKSHKKRGYEMMKQLLALPEPPDSVVCFNDMLAVGVYQALEEAGLMPGKDIGVVGYDNTHISAELPVRLTTVRFPSYEIGKKACEILLDMVNGVEYKENHTVIFQPELIIRDSC